MQSDFGSVKFWFSSQEANEGSCFRPLAGNFQVKRTKFRR
ncbi:hypothetical protein AT3G46616 [Arabidopsis thaliana]|uniref:Uncharacterized protein n=2 Tax=Arabidopsis TaxID=3701 RepID=A0A1I9LS20_ARATH|nr:uncharacterized protein AT3G46616 [Arabidopsis thaliana]ANM65378.1 hypothetical protein AT3G46616 [Arabidopsis thaliana]|eukprot:NP_001327353.1 hypothetical protein AT3G46616 [Arabidopsis thaliana]